MAGKVSVITAYVAGYSISGVTVIDLPNVPQTVNSQDCPILMPDLYEDQFMQNLQFVRQSYGDGLTARVDLHYQLQWALFYKPFEENVTLFNNYAGMVTSAMACLTAFLNNQLPDSSATGVIDFTPADLPKLGIVRDPSGTPFWGASFRMDCYEFAA